VWREHGLFAARRIIGNQGERHCMHEVLKKIGEIGLVPVVKLERAEDALLLGKALIEGDLPVAEITFRTGAAEEAIRILTGELPELLVGAGTVLSVGQAQKAVSAGARFIVSPGFNPKVVDYCVENGIPVTPGINSPTQIEMALDRGLEVVKFFPAEASGGLALLKAMAAPYSGIQFIPTGGIDRNNLMVYLSNSRVHACGGSWMVKADLIASGSFDEITRITRDAVSTMLGFAVAHLGIHEESRDKASAAATFLSSLFFFSVNEKTASIFAGQNLEIAYSPFPGRKGHIAISTNDMQRAVAYLKRKGISILPETAKEKDGRLTAVYIDGQVSGFAIHLLQH
jgi:2-dehydro-3-deoxyphosphogluconate aldolase/(4S)-4-hydroxy-2-oxoglutarate aldolase